MNSPRQDGAEAAESDAGRPAVPHPPTAAMNRRTWLAWFAIVLVAFVLRVVVVRQYEALHPNAAHPIIDEAAYDRWARAIAAGDWMGKDVFFQEPLYPYLLGVAYSWFGPERLLVRLAQALLGALACVVVGRLAERIFGRAVGLAAAAGLAVYGPLLLFPAYLLKEAVFVPLFALFAWLLVRSRDSTRPCRAWFVLGIVAGAGVLLRGNVLVLAPCFALWPIARVGRSSGRRRAALLSSAAFLGGLALVLAPVAARNHHVGGVWVLSTSQAGTNFYAGNNAENPYGRAMEVSFVRGIPEHEAGDWRREAERRSGHSLDAGEVSSFWTRVTLHSFATEPWQRLAGLWNKLRLSLGAYEVPDNHLYAWDRERVPSMRFPWLDFGVLGAFGLAGLVWFARASRRKGIDAGCGVEIAVLFASYLATIVLTVTSDRARLPLVPLLAPFAAWVPFEIVRAVRSRSWLDAAALALLVCVAFASVEARVLPRSELDEDRDEREFNLAVQLVRDEGRLDEARAITAGLVQRHPRSVRSRVLAAQIDVERLRSERLDAKQGVRAAARDELRALDASLAPYAELASLAPREKFRLAVVRGSIASALGEWASAAERFRAALEFDGDDRGLQESSIDAELGAAESEGGERALDRLRDVQARLIALRGPKDDGGTSSWSADEVASLALAWARSEALRGRLLLASADEADRREGRSAVQNALETLRPVAADTTLAPGLRQAARRLAGRVQLQVGTDAALESAEKHFRAALALGDDLESVLGLAQVLVTRAERSEEGRAQRLQEVDALVLRLAAADGSAPALQELRARRSALR